MQVRYHKKYSKHLKRDMEFKVYGKAGKPALFFPSQNGRFFQCEDFGMIEACGPFIEDGCMTAYCVDSVDAESWSAFHRSPRERIERHEEYTRYIMEELLPVIRHDSQNQPLLLSGASLGAAHAANFFFRFPPMADSLIALSGIYCTRQFFGDYMDSDVYYNSVIDYLGNLEDETILNHLRRSNIVICTGQGAYEDFMLSETWQLKLVLERKNIPACIDVWGRDVNHDWYWWRKQLQYFLGHMFKDNYESLRAHLRERALPAAE